MSNLLKETIERITENGQSTDDVIWVGNLDGSLWCTWREFEERANFKYDSGYGGAEIPLDLTVVGSNWWLERHEYDGSEWWEFKTLPIRQSAARTIISLKGTTVRELSSEVSD